MSLTRKNTQNAIDEILLTMHTHFQDIFSKKNNNLWDEELVEYHTTHVFNKIWDKLINYANDSGSVESFTKLVGKIDVKKLVDEYGIKDDDHKTVITRAKQELAAKQSVLEHIVIMYAFLAKLSLILKFEDDIDLIGSIKEQMVLFESTKQRFLTACYQQQSYSTIVFSNDVWYQAKTGIGKTLDQFKLTVENFLKTHQELLESLNSSGQLKKVEKTKTLFSGGSELNLTWQETVKPKHQEKPSSKFNLLTWISKPTSTTSPSAEVSVMKNRKS